MPDIDTDTIIVSYDEVTLEVEYEVYESDKHKRVVYTATPIGLADQAVLNAIEEHLKMKKDKHRLLENSFEMAPTEGEKTDEKYPRLRAFVRVKV